LAGVAVTQVFSPGAPVMYGAVPTAMDLRSMDFTMGSVEMAMMNSMAPRLAKLYELPIYGTAGITESKRPEIQAGLEKAFSIITVAMARADLIHLAAGMLDSGNSISYEQFVIDNEIIGMARRLIRGMDMSEEALAHEVISKVGPGGNYVVEDHTVEHMMDEFFYPELAIRKNFDIWEEQDKLTMLKKANQRVEIILRNSVDGLMDPDTIIKIKEEFIGLSRI
jgi:trimethylamine--corrinoid protein Co-methyltransferase